MTDLAAPINTTFALTQVSKARAEQAASNVKAAGQDISPEEDARLTEVAQDFEAMFLSEMLKPMFEGIKPDPVFGGGKGEEVFQGFMIDKYGKMMSERGGIGIADAVKNELVKLQEGKNAQNTVN